MKILGIDPGTAITGFGLIEAQGQKFKLIDAGVIRTAAKSPLPERLKIIYDDLSQLIKSAQPDEMAVEELFFVQNITTGISVSHARGVVLLCAANQQLSVAEYKPLQIKQALTGYGRAEKSQIQEMVRVMLKLKTVPKPDDAADALAVAIAHATSLKTSRLA